MTEYLSVDLCACTAVCTQELQAKVSQAVKLEMDGLRGMKGKTDPDNLLNGRTSED